MRVDNVRQLFGGTFHLQRQDRFGDQLGRIRPDDVHAQDLAVLGVGNDLDEAFVLPHDAGARVRSEGELANLHGVTLFLRLGFGEAHASDLGMAIGRVGNAQRVDRLHRLARDVRDRHDAFHGAGVRQLRQPHDDVADGVNPGLGGTHELVDLHGAPVELDLRLFDTDILGHRRAAHCDQHLLGLQLLLLAIDGKGDGDARLGLFHFFYLGVYKAVDAALAIYAHQLLRHFFVFDRYVTRQHLQNSHVRSEGFVDAGELDAHCARADHDQRLGNLVQAQHLDIGQDLHVRLQAGQHAGRRTGAKYDVLGLDRLQFAAFHRNRVDAVLRRAGQFAICADHVHLVLLHQEHQALGMFVHDALLALLDRAPVQRDTSRVFQAKFHAFLDVVENLCVEQQGLGRNATDMQAGAAQVGIFLDEGGLQPKLPGANRRSVSRGPAADDGYVVDCLWQVRAPV